MTTSGRSPPNSSTGFTRSSRLGPGESPASPRLSGKVCIVTGTGGSIGREAAVTFAREGASVVGCDLDVDAAQGTVEMVRREGGTIASLHPCHLSDPAHCQALIEFAMRTFSRIDVLFNNVAMACFNRPEDTADDGWLRNRRDEVDLVFYLTRAAWPHLKASRGVIVNTASFAPLRDFSDLGSLAHTTAKAEIVAMTRQLAMEGRDHGIRANSISPGVIETNETRQRMKDPDRAGHLLGKTLLGRLGRPEDVVSVALFLASGASSYVTGVDIVVDGGMRV